MTKPPPIADCCTFGLNADGFWQCSQCGWVYSRKTDQAPVRNCGPAGVTLDRGDVILAVHAGTPAMPHDRDEIRRRLDICKTNACGYFDGVCTERGSNCRKFRRWLERVLLGDCKHWSPS